MRFNNYELSESKELVEKWIAEALNGIVTDEQQEEYYLAGYDGGWDYLNCLFEIRREIKELIEEQK